MIQTRKRNLKLRKKIFEDKDDEHSKRQLEQKELEFMLVNQ